MVTRAMEPQDSQGMLKDQLPRRESGPAPASGGERELRTLSPQECLSLLEPGGVGRVGFTSAAGVVILPVNFAMAGKAVIFRTAPDTLLAVHGNAPVSFEADQFDEARREGWSVLVIGHAHKAASEQEVRRLEHATGLEPWAGGARDVYVRIMPSRISGRRIVSATGPGGPRRV
jgi:hypothetical protein